MGCLQKYQAATGDYVESRDSRSAAGAGGLYIIMGKKVGESE